MADYFFDKNALKPLSREHDSTIRRTRLIASCSRLFGYAKAFQKDWGRLERSGRFNMRLLKEAMLLLIANDGPLGPEWRDHALTGEWSDHRECHIGGDFLLIYRVDEDARPDANIVFVRAGSHAELFRE